MKGAELCSEQVGIINIVDAENTSRLSGLDFRIGTSSPTFLERRTAATGTNQLAYADLIRRTLTQPGKENEVKIQMRPSITLPDGSALPAALRHRHRRF